jgi:tight adherence protein B
VIDPLWILYLALALATAIALWFWSVVRPRLAARDRLLAGLEGAETTSRRPVPRPLTERLRLLPWAVALVVGALLLFLSVPAAMALAAAVVVGLLTWQWEKARLFKLQLLIESQLADALDLMVGSLRAGASLMAAMDSALQESRKPLRPELEEALSRLRMGDKPQEVFSALTARVPLETFALFTSALSIHWEVGGSLAPTLAVVGRAIRDRIALTRRVRALTAEGRLSILAVLAITYFIALMMWVSDPERMQVFLRTNVGAALVAGAILLQGIGIVWGAVLCRLKF